MEISLWKRLRTCRKTDYRINEGGIAAAEELLFIVRNLFTCARKMIKVDILIIQEYHCFRRQSIFQHSYLNMNFIRRQNY
jgi:hypothetical protein